MCMKFTEQNVNSIFIAIVATDDPCTQAQLVISLQALAKVHVYSTALFCVIALHDFFLCTSRLKSWIFQWTGTKQQS